jgi:sulfur-oxidizing protein SoxY
MSVDMQRRVFLKGSLAAGAMGLAIGAGLLTPRVVLAAWPKQAFKAKKLPEAMQALFGGDQAAKSGDIALKVPEIAENGAVVPVKVQTGIDNIESITVFSINNPAPLVASFNLGEGALGLISTRIKMGKTGDVVAVVKAGGKLYSARKIVKVTIGGCGG